MNTHNYPTWLVSLDIAKELKKIGFDGRCLFAFDTEKNDLYLIQREKKACVWYEDISLLYEPVVPPDSFLVPAWTDVFVWFRARGLHCSIRYLVDLETYSYYIHDSCNWYKGSGNRDTYEEAIEACVEDLIKIFNENKDR